MSKYACYRIDNSFICDVIAASEQEALVKAKAECLDAAQVILVRIGNDLGTSGLN